MNRLAMRFWTKVAITTTDQCWEWKASKRPLGYGQFRYIGSKYKHAHWVAHELIKGPVPADKMVLHSCDNRGCVNPGHLRIGTAKDNRQDTILRNRHNAAKGEQHHKSRLSLVAAKEIKKLLSEGVKPMDISRQFNIGHSSVYQIRDGVLWKHA